MKPGQGQRSAAADALNSSSAAPVNEPVTTARTSTSIASQAIHGHSSEECMLSLGAAFVIRED